VDDLIPYGADGAVLAPLLQLHLERLSERQHRDRVIYGLAD